MFDKILIANRGEIACRVIRSARRLGIRTVAVYSDADADARHVRLADEALRIGPAPARDSYLVIERILAAARRSGAQAIHPGYGFLSENADFSEACARAGVVFIGPPAAAIRAMGSKAEAKRRMEAAGVPVTPGYHGDDQSPGGLRAQADALGYPVLIKAVAGGGGKGMRVVGQAEDFIDLLAACRREAAASFGDERVLIEKYLVRPRHIEVQVFADAHGHCVHLFERDCSVQRRHQKVLEEAPAPGIGPAQRAAMGQAAVAAAQAVGYVGAGTVEFIVGEAGTAPAAFYFMEMNTRLQVEHPVTEMITGLDLVEWQLRVAWGEALPLAQEQLQIRGHAIEARIYAEDPTKGFLPATGRLLHLARPAESVHVRIDSGVDEGDAIGPDYDPLIAKLIVWEEGGAADPAGGSRERARLRLLQALADFQLVGVAHNVDFLSRLAACPAFARGELDTGLIEREQGWLFPAADPVPAEVWYLAALAELLRESRAAAEAAWRSADPCSPWHARDGWRLNACARRVLVFRHGVLRQAVQVEYRADAFALGLDPAAGAWLAARGELGERGQLRAELDGRCLDATVISAGEARHVFLDGRSWGLACVDPLAPAAGEGVAEGGLRAPMPGRVVALLAQPGQRVEKGAALLSLEAMKMEHTLTAPAAGTVKAFHCALGDQVDDGAELLEFEAEP
ncbi:acetyl/propionyl/methylcrotonyl-CoA carboxylase subunit alpha [Thauera aromatica]|uniref:Methylcrotonyl-CoA carboxylase biotin-containingsubunit n=1 Tax=Thauera aromatica K172 TaxID=44139 RepID=A0A2R4BR69_THAAR|nr:acetyl/propionyl/methylcrotonyl-CoA carboxylase subunit alpha [Thauera aromatica]AVR89825.1 Methylcrotonyl-CoA carboxylase biotin-containingsubunit [Thauera aromatica K172]